MTDPVRWGILGCGRVAGGFATGLLAVPGAELVAVAYRHRSTADGFSARHGGVKVHEHYHDLAADPDIDVVYVATPNDRHARDALECLRFGKAVLCEKPFTIDAAEARRVVDEARARRLFCMEGMWMRFIPAVRRTVALIEQGAIGEVRTIHADFSHPVALTTGSRLFDPAQGGGALLDLGVYTLSLAQHLLGEPERVGSHLAVGATGVDEHASVSLGSACGATATLTASLRARGPNRAVIAGSTGTIHLPGPICAPTSLVIEPVAEMTLEIGDPTSENRITRAVRANPHAVRAARSVRRVVGSLARNGSQTTRLPLSSTGYESEVAEVVRCLRAGELESPTMPLDESLRTIELIERIRCENGLEGGAGVGR